MNFKKTLSLAALLIATTALLAISSFANPTLTVNNTANAGTVLAPVYASGVYDPSNPTVPITTVVPALQVSITFDAGATDCAYVESVNLVAGPSVPVDCTLTTTVNVPAVGGLKTTYKFTITEKPAGARALSIIYGFTSEAQLPPPTFTPNGSVGATIATITGPLVNGKSATVHYTVNGGASTLYLKPFLIADNQQNGEVTLSAGATALGYFPSPNASAIFGSAYGVASNAFIAAGSSAQAAEYALAFGGVYGDGFGGACGGHHFSLSNGGYAVDSRSTSTSNDLGNLVIVWDNSNDTTDPNVHPELFLDVNNNPIYPAPTSAGQNVKGWVDTDYIPPAGDTQTIYVGGQKLYANPAPPSKICVYLQLDSTLGVKAFLNSNLTIPGGSLSLSPAQTHVGSSNSISPFWFFGASTATAATTWAAGGVPDEDRIPADVYAAANGRGFNAGVTDIRPEDAYFATARALAAQNATRTGLGYNGSTAGIGTTINSIAGSTFNVASFALAVKSKDPINGGTQQPYTTVPIGAAPVVVIVNKTVSSNSANDGLFHFGDSSIKNIGRFTLAQYLNGAYTGTKYLDPNPNDGLAAAPVHTWIREPLSGTYNTMEFDVVRSAEIGSSQEIGVDTTNNAITGCTSGFGGSTSAVFTGTWGAGCAGFTSNGSASNPLWYKVGSGNTTQGPAVGVSGATRARAIGTGEMVKQVALAGNYDSIGYTFWGYGNIKSGNNHADTQTKYLTVDGVDPINAAYSTGLVPTCTTASYSVSTGCPSRVTFANVINGSYPIWSVYRAVVPLDSTGQVPSFVATVLGYAQSAATTVQDFAPLTSMQVFRSHYKQSGILVPLNGNVANEAEAGGDMGGAVFTKAADLEHVADYGTEIVNVKQ